VELEKSELWQKFHSLTNEMIITKSGRLATLLILKQLPTFSHQFQKTFPHTEGQFFRIGQKGELLFGHGNPSLFLKYISHIFSRILSRAMAINGNFNPIRRIGPLLGTLVVISRRRCKNRCCIYIQIRRHPESIGCPSWHLSILFESRTMSPMVPNM
jgi:hypothetical protein